MFPGPPVGTVRLNNSDDDLDELGSAWEERHRRARSVRLLIMFLTMLLLMDGDPKSRENQRQNRSSKRKSELNSEEVDQVKSSLGSGFGETLVSAQWRIQQFHWIQSALEKHPRLEELNKMNTALQKAEKEEPFEVDQDVKNSHPLLQRRYYYYPKNATGHYRGFWTRLPPTATLQSNATSLKDTISPHSIAELQVQQALLSTNESIGLILLPEVSPFETSIIFTFVLFAYLTRCTQLYRWMGTGRMAT